MKPAVCMHNSQRRPQAFRQILTACLNRAKQEQASYHENTPEWIVWEEHVMHWEHRLVMWELNDGPPQSIVRNNL
jgi:hypothetical protein